MGNGVGKLTVCFTGEHPTFHRKQFPSSGGAGGMAIIDTLDDLGHSFCYLRPELNRLSSSKIHSEFDEPQTTTFKSISGASVSAYTSTPLSTALIDLYSDNSIDRASTFEGSTSFASLLLQPIPRNSYVHSGPIYPGFMSGPIKRTLLSGPLDRGIFSGPIDQPSSDHFHRSYLHGFRPKSRKGSIVRALKRALSKGHSSIVAPIKGVVAMKQGDWVVGTDKYVCYASY